MTVTFCDMLSISCMTTLGDRNIFIKIFSILDALVDNKSHVNFLPGVAALIIYWSFDLKKKRGNPQKFGLGTGCLDSNKYGI